MKCTDIRGLVVARPHLSRDERAALRDHLAGCADCAAYCRRDDETRQLLQRLPEPARSPSSPVFRRTRERIQGEPMRRFKPLAALAVFAVLIMLALGASSLISGLRQAPRTAGHPPAQSPGAVNSGTGAVYPTPGGQSAPAAYPTPGAQRVTAPYPGPGETPAAPNAYPPPATEIALVEGPVFTLDLPLKGGANAACGSGPASVPLRLVNINRNGVTIGQTVIGGDGRFCIDVAGGLPEGEVVGLRIGDLDGTPFRPEQFIKGATYLDMPNIGILLATAAVE